MPSAGSTYCPSVEDGRHYKGPGCIIGPRVKRLILWRATTRLSVACGPHV